MFIDYAKVPATYFFTDIFFMNFVNITFYNFWAFLQSWLQTTLCAFCTENKTDTGVIYALLYGRPAEEHSIASLTSSVSSLRKLSFGQWKLNTLQTSFSLWFFLLKEARCEDRILCLRRRSSSTDGLTSKRFFIWILI